MASERKIVSIIAICLLVQICSAPGQLSAQDSDSKYEPMLYFITIGKTMPNASSMLNEYWRDAIAINVGFRLPYCFWCDYMDFLIYGSYDRFPFKKGARFPIDSFGQESIVALTGDPFQIYSLFPCLKFSLRSREKRFIPYILYGYGYIIRGDLVLNSESSLFPYFSKEYDNSISLMFSYGMDYALKDHMRLLFEISLSGPITGNTEGAYLTTRVGVAMR